jgi:hypothetical protein
MLDSPLEWMTIAPQPESGNNTPSRVAIGDAWRLRMRVHYPLRSLSVPQFIRETCEPLDRTRTAMAVQHFRKGTDAKANAVRTTRRWSQAVLSSMGRKRRNRKYEEAHRSGEHSRWRNLSTELDMDQEAERLWSGGRLEIYRSRQEIEKPSIRKQRVC